MQNAYYEEKVGGLIDNLRPQVHMLEAGYAHLLNTLLKITFISHEVGFNACKCDILS